MPQDKVSQYFQTALMVVGLTCLLLSPNRPGRVQGLGGAQQAIASNCPPNFHTVQVSRDSVLNVRSQPNGEIIGDLPAGTAVWVEQSDRSGQWSQVSTNSGARGWVYQAYLGRATGCSGD